MARESRAKLLTSYRFGSRSSFVIDKINTASFRALTRTMDKVAATPASREGRVEFNLSLESGVRVVGIIIDFLEKSGRVRS